uniref:NTR domain-containing protein n=1 Tax=Parastrongyloides trichosuri TaxID=131310 RepID=A0A0N4ZI49_PARTI
MPLILSIVFALLTTFPKATYSCSPQMQCNNVGHGKDLVGEYSPNVQWSFNSKGLNVNNQPTSLDEVKEKILADIKHIVDTSKKEVNKKLVLAGVTFTRNGALTRFKECTFKSDPSNTCGRIECRANEAVTWGTSGNKLDITITKSNVGIPQHYIKNDICYENKKGLCAGNPNAKKNGRAVWLPFRVRVQFKVTPEVPKVCDSHWDEIKREIETNLMTKHPVRGLSWHKKME